MNSDRARRPVHLRPDHLVDELTSVLAASGWVEFKPLFEQIYVRLRERKAAGAGEEMLRLRMYDRLQTFVREGVVEKDGKRYRGVPARLAPYLEHNAAEHCRDLLKAVVTDEPA